MHVHLFSVHATTMLALCLALYTSSRLSKKFLILQETIFRKRTKNSRKILGFLENIERVSGHNAFFTAFIKQMQFLCRNDERQHRILFEMMNIRKTKG